MYQKGDAAHIEAMNTMMELMHNPSDMDKWYGERKREFDAL